MYYTSLEKMEQITPPTAMDIAAIMKTFATELKLVADNQHSSEAQLNRLATLEQTTEKAATLFSETAARGAKTKSMQKHSLAIPELKEISSSNELDYNNIKAYTNTFSGKDDEIGDGHEVMAKILTLIDDKGMDHAQAFGAIAVALDGEAFTHLRLYKASRPKPQTKEEKQKHFEEFVDSFLTAYPPSTTPEDMLEQLRTLTRQRGEKLSVAVQRISKLVQQTASLYPFESEDTRFARIVHDKLVQLTTRTSLYRLRSQFHNIMKSGRAITVKEVFEIIESEEQQHPDIKNQDPISPDMPVVLATNVEDSYYNASPISAPLRRREDSRDRRRQRSLDRSSRSRQNSFNANRSINDDRTPSPQPVNRDRISDMHRPSRPRPEVARPVDKIMRPTQLPARHHQYVPQDYQRLKEVQRQNMSFDRHHNRPPRNFGTRNNDSNSWHRQRQNRNWSDRQEGSNNSFRSKQNQNQQRRSQMRLPAFRHKYEFMCTRCIDARGGFDLRLRPSRYQDCAYCQQLSSNNRTNAINEADDVSVNLINIDGGDASIFPQFQSKHTLN